MNHQTPKIIYLASPYSHPCQNVRQDRYEQAVIAAAKLMEAGYVVFSPIAHSHHVADFLPEGTVTDHEFWMRQDLPLLRKCSAVFVLRLDGWEKSRGVTEEIHQARHRGIPVLYCDLAFNEGTADLCFKEPDSTRGGHSPSLEDFSDSVKLLGFPEAVARGPLDDEEYREKWQRQCRWNRELQAENESLRERIKTMVDMYHREEARAESNKSALYQAWRAQDDKAERVHQFEVELSEARGAFEGSDVENHRLRRENEQLKNDVAALQLEIQRMNVVALNGYTDKDVEIARLGDENRRLAFVADRAQSTLRHAENGYYHLLGSYQRQQHNLLGRKAEIERLKSELAEEIEERVGFVKKADATIATLTRREAGLRQAVVMLAESYREQEKKQRQIQTNESELRFDRIQASGTGDAMANFVQVLEMALKIDYSAPETANG